MSESPLYHFAERLVAQGVRLAFGVTGSGASLQLIRALQELGVAYYPVFHEASAALMAGGAGHDGKLKAVAISIKGPGFINLMPGLLTNQYENRPMFSISEAYGDNIPDFRMHKRLAHENLCQEVVGAYARVNQSPDIVTNMLTLAEAEMPIPVHFDLTNDTKHPFQPIIYKTQNTQESYDNELALQQPVLQKCVETLQKAARPVIILGSVAARCYKHLDWNNLKVPIITTASAKGVVDETKEYSAGIITGEVSPLTPESNIIAQADCILAIGLRNTEVIKANSFDIPLFIVDTSPGEIHDGFSATAIISDETGEVIKTLIDAIQLKSWGADMVEQYQQKILQVFAEEAWCHAKVFSWLQHNLTFDYSLVVDTGFFCTVAEMVFQAKNKMMYIGSGIGRFMGVALPSAIGFSAAYPEKVVLCAVGDGGLPPYLAELKLAINRKLPIIVLFFSDGRYGSVASYSTDCPEVRQGVNFDDMDWYQTVAAMGATAHQVSCLEQLEMAIQQWQAKEGVLFLQLDFDPQSYARTAKLLR